MPKFKWVSNGNGTTQLSWDKFFLLRAPTAAVVYNDVGPTGFGTQNAMNERAMALAFSRS